MLSTDDNNPEDAIGAQLDQEIEDLQSQIATLKHRRRLSTTTILTSHTTQSILSGLKSHNAHPPSSTHLSKTLTAQNNRDLETLYRSCAGVTTFPIQDPDPNAVDGGRVLGIRFDVCTNHGKFIRPYYVMLNRPYTGEGKEFLRVHRHTLPPAIPVAGLVERWLPSPSGAEKGVEKKPKQDIKRFIRFLRREIISYHLRLSAIKNLRRTFGLDDAGETGRKGKGKRKDRVIMDVMAIDAEAKQVRIEWADGRTGRFLVDGKGVVGECVVVGEAVRDMGSERRVVGDDGRVEGVGGRLLEGIY